MSDNGRTITPDVNRQRKQEAVYALAELLEKGSDPAFTGEVEVRVQFKAGRIMAVKTGKNRQGWTYYPLAREG